MPAFGARLYPVLWGGGQGGQLPTKASMSGMSRRE